jgi:hypothetical protein
MGFHRKFENGTLIKHKVACGFTQVPGLDYQEAYLYAPVMHLKSFRVDRSLFDYDLHHFDVSAAEWR